MQTSEPMRRLSLTNTNRPAWDIAEQVKRGAWELSPPYQRGDVWTLTQRQRLIESFCRGIPVPAITVNDRTSSDWAEVNGNDPLDTGIGMYAVIDGKQRLETCRQWYNSEFGVPASWFDPRHVETTFETADGPYVTFDGLTAPAKRRWEMSQAQLPVNGARLSSVEEEAALYLLLNGGGTEHTEADLERARDLLA